MKKIMLVTLALAIMASFSLLVSCSGSGKSPAEVSKSFLLNIEKGDIDAAYNLLNSTGEATEEEMQKMKAFLGEASKQLAEKKGIKSIEVVEENISEDGSEANVTLKVTYGDGEVDETNSVLRNSGEGWKISIEK
ncbi:hypothetical protein DSECCO2_246820 [anaerobic digester metagenome]